MEWFTDPQIWMALVTLTALEIVLGIDNIIFITIIAGRLPVSQQARGRQIGLLLAMVTRIALLFSLTLIMRLTEPLITVLGEGISGRDMILIAGGLFLLGKSTLEIHSNLEGEAGHENGQHTSPQVSFMGIIVQIMILDIVFSLDSVITAIGLTNQLPIMVTAIIIAVIVMIFLAGTISRFVEAHPTVKILALSFLLLIGLALIGEGFEMHIPKGYIYFAMTFSLFVEVLNMKMRKTKITPVKLRKKHSDKV
ncbi:TerC family protein [Desulfococcaceae bacterium HSG7]|nr:TerC family protein [Desulfococcaceae bacterium HSG9]MDM8553723.1 TerC family protein [Desulfococcaceae bacterium HSG7]